MNKFINQFLILFLMTPLFANAQDFDWQGHRGCRGVMPENSVEGFLKALEYPVTTLELDVVITKDKKVLVSHEPWISGKICTLNGKSLSGNDKELYNIYLLNYKQVQSFDCGSKIIGRFREQEKLNTKKPLLSEVFDAVNKSGGGNVNYNIEIKSTPEEDGVYHPEVKEFSDLVVELVKSYMPVERFTIQSFDFRVLEYIHKSYPDIQLAMLVEKGSLESHLEQLSFTPGIYSPYYKILSKETVQACHEKGMKVIPWTVNDVKSMNKLRSIGVDGIITDYPNLIFEVK